MALSEPEGGTGEASNPGEWPWAVLIYDESGYLGAGALLANDVVVTLATKVSSISASSLIVRVGDWDPRTTGPGIEEDFSHLEMEVKSVALHPDFNASSLAFNVAVLILSRNEELDEVNLSNAVTIRKSNRDPFKSLVSLRKEFGSSDEFSLRIGLLADMSALDPLGERRSNITRGRENQGVLPMSYINNVCLPTVSGTGGAGNQFPAGTRC